jgi:hypothetical protein
MVDKALKETTMKKIFSITIIVIGLLFGCSPAAEYIYWTEETENQLQRLNEAKINYEIRNGEIWVKERDMDKVIG